MTLLIETPRKKRVPVESLIEKLYRTEGKAEIVNGEIKEFSVSFETADNECKLPSGSTAENIETAANHAGFKIELKGETSALLRKKESPPFAFA